MTKETKINQLIPDDKNFNQGTQYGQHLIEESLRRFGAGRSVLLDKNNRIIAGNKTIENAAAIGMEDVIVVETTGNKIVAVKRTDIDLDTREGRELALADNATSAVNLRWDEDALAKAAEEYDISPKDWAVDINDAPFFDDDFSDVTVSTGGGGGGMGEECRIIIVYKEHQAERVANLLGLEKIEKPVYTLTEIRNGNKNQQSTQG